MALRSPLLALTLLLLAASCTKSVERPHFGGKKGASPTGEGDQSPFSPGGGSPTATPPVPVVPVIPSVIQLANTKFSGEESKLEALVKFNGVSSARVKLTAATDSASISVPGLTPDKADTLVVEIYEGQKLRFLARRANTTVEKGKSNSWKLEDCSVSKLPWTGEANESTCGWSVQDNK